jgi:hypothetical protein
LGELQKIELEFLHFLMNPVATERLVPPRRDGDASLHFVQGRLSDEQASSRAESKEIPKKVQKA